MFDIGFSELLVVFVVGLLILGPERLPHAAKMAGLWVRKIKRSINSVQREINAQLDQEELQQKIQETNQRLLKEERSIQNTILPVAEKNEIKVSAQPEPSAVAEQSSAVTEQSSAVAESPQNTEPNETLDADLIANSPQAQATDNKDKTPDAISRA
ncbi:twin-arginine translocase subunit TatB [Marinomonas sp. M1K-6]|uniref:Sec-independent protein translocase protein TatB n=1 Tax=Marinomonas profundi TaxID=2726122 RepID=A0A847QW71_9GAMM|nr:Sec-independent protein translocase protein TatB [Marinomonas profundi]NLQ17508.1 twin-arginine translocase subunit TatB [Marinomonas profundi]UDV02029.1 twin-arginine translocase subunit TatB [Marinomonas profundi]